MFKYIKFYIVILAALVVACHSENKKDKILDNLSDSNSHMMSNEVTLTRDQARLIELQFGKIEKRKLSSDVKANGALRVPNGHKGIVTALFGGVIQTLNVEYGAYVRKGQLIATISNPQFIQSQEEYLLIKNKTNLAELELKRQQELDEGNAGIKRDLQLATTELNNLRARQASLREQLKLMGIQPDDISTSKLKSMLELRAPISGIVKDVFAKIGSYVDVSSPIAEIVDNNGLHLDLHVYEKDLPHLKVGQSINFTITNNPVEIYKARIFNIGSSFEDDSKTISVHCDVIGNKVGLIDGMSVRAFISMDDIFANTLPNDAVVESEGKFYIFTEKNSNDQEITFTRIEVIKGASEMGYTEITPVFSLPENANIVIKGAFFINAKMVNTGEEH